MTEQNATKIVVKVASQQYRQTEGRSLAKGLFIKSREQMGRNLSFIYRWKNPESGTCFHQQRELRQLLEQHVSKSSIKSLAGRSSFVPSDLRKGIQRQWIQFPFSNIFAFKKLFMIAKDNLRDKENPTCFVFGKSIVISVSREILGKANNYITQGGSRDATKKQHFVDQKQKT